MYWFTTHHGESDFTKYNHRLQSHKVHCHGNNGGSIWGCCTGGYSSIGMCSGGSFWSSLKSGLGYGLAMGAINLLFNGIGRLFGGFMGGSYGAGFGMGGLGGGNWLGGLGNGTWNSGNNTWGIGRQGDKKTNPGSKTVEKENADQAKLNEIDTKANNILLNKMKNLPTTREGLTALQSEITGLLNDLDKYSKADGINTKADDDQIAKIKERLNACKTEVDTAITALPSVEEVENADESGATDNANDAGNVAGEGTPEVTADEQATRNAYTTAGITKPEDITALAQAGVTPGLAKACKDQGIDNTDDIIAISGSGITEEDLRAAEGLIPEGKSIKDLANALENKDNAITLLTDLNLVKKDNDKTVAKFHPNFVVLKLIEKSGLNVQFAHNSVNNTYLEGKLENLAKDNNGRVSYDIADQDCTYSLLSMKDEPTAYKLTDIVNTGFKTTQTDVNEAEGDIDYVNPNWKERIYKYDNQTKNLELQEPAKMGQLISDGHTQNIEQYWIQLKKGEDAKTAPSNYGS